MTFYSYGKMLTKKKLNISLIKTWLLYKTQNPSQQTVGLFLSTGTSETLALARRSDLISY
jgi:hypothetical protein